MANGEWCGCTNLLYWTLLDDEETLVMSRSLTDLVDSYIK
jgi:hypothetical protein